MSPTEASTTTALAKRFVDEGVQFQVEDILVNGPPWNTRVAIRVQSFIPERDRGADVYNNRAVLVLEIRWGRLLRWEGYEDTERVTIWDHNKTQSEH